MLLSAERDLSMDTVVQNLDLVLRALPEEVLNEQVFGRDAESAGSGRSCSPASAGPHNSADVARHAQAQDAMDQVQDLAAISARGSDEESTSDAVRVERETCVCTLRSERVG